MPPNWKDAERRACVTELTAAFLSEHEAYLRMQKAHRDALEADPATPADFAEFLAVQAWVLQGKIEAAEP